MWSRDRRCSVRSRAAEVAVVLRAQRVPGLREADPRDRDRQGRCRAGRGSAMSDYLTEAQATLARTFDPGTGDVVGQDAAAAMFASICKKHPEGPSRREAIARLLRSFASRAPVPEPAPSAKPTGEPTQRDSE